MIQTWSDGYLVFSETKKSNSFSPFLKFFKNLPSKLAKAATINEKWRKDKNPAITMQEIKIFWSLVFSMMAGLRRLIKLS